MASIHEIKKCQTISCQCPFKLQKGHVHFCPGTERRHVRSTHSDTVHIIPAHDMLQVVPSHKNPLMLLVVPLRSIQCYISIVPVRGTQCHILSLSEASNATHRPCQKHPIMLHILPVRNIHCYISSLSEAFYNATYPPCQKYPMLHNHILPARSIL